MELTEYQRKAILKKYTRKTIRISETTETVILNTW